MFSVALDAPICFRGMMSPEIGAAALRLPMMHYDPKRHTRRLKLGACQGAFYGSALVQRINPAPLQQFLTQRWQVSPVSPR